MINPKSECRNPKQFSNFQNSNFEFVSNFEFRVSSLTLVIVSCLLVISGCGYTTKTLLPPHVKTIYIDNVHNKIDITKETGYDEAHEIYRPGLEREIRKAIKDRFIFDGKLKVVNEKEKASSVLNCDILDFEKQPLRYRDDKTIEEYRLKLVVSLKFTDLVDNAVLIDESEFVGEKTYSLSGPFVSSESSAQTEAITDLARRIVERVVDIW